MPEPASLSGPQAFPYPWSTPDVPDLGCFVRQKHGFERDYDFNRWMEFAPWEMTPAGPVFLPHQAYVRIQCGEASFYQRVGVNMLAYPSTFTDLFGRPFDWVLGGDHRPAPTDWIKYPPQSGPKDYWLSGEYRNPASGGWHADAAVGHSFDIYDNGTLSRVGFDDTGGDRDYDDLVVEVAIVYRRNYFLLLDPPVATSRKAAEKFDREVFPDHLSRRDARPPRAPVSAK